MVPINRVAWLIAYILTLGAISLVFVILLSGRFGDADTWVAMGPLILALGLTAGFIAAYEIER